MLQEGPEEVWALVCVQEGSGHFLGQVMNSMRYEASDFRKRHDNEGCRGYLWCLFLGRLAWPLVVMPWSDFPQLNCALKTVARARLLC